ncbi:MAG: tetratricopeptide repeat protein [Dysgonomonas sp.]
MIYRKRNYRHSFISLLVLLLVFNGQSIAQIQDVKEAKDLLSKGEIAMSLKITNSSIDKIQHKKSPINKSDSTLLIRLFNLSGNAYQQLGNYSRSFSYYQKGLDIARKMELDSDMANIYNNLSSLCYDMKDLEQSKTFVELALALNKKQNNKKDIIKNYNNLGVFYFNQKNYNKAHDYLLQAFKIIPDSDRLGKSLVLTNISQIYYDQKKFAKALTTLQQANSLQSEIPFTIDMVQTQLNTIMALVQLGKMKPAQQLMQKAEQKIEMIETPTVKSNSYEYLADICFTMKDSIQGLRYLLAYHALNDSIKNEAENRLTKQLIQTSEMERLQYNNSQLAQSLDIMKLETQRRQLLFGGGLFIAVICALFLLMILRQREKLRKYERLEFKKQEKNMVEKIDYRNRQLTSYTMEQAAGNILMQKVKGDLMMLQKETKNNQDAEKIIKDIQTEISSYNNKQLGEDFRTYFDQVHPNLLLKLSLTYPQLSKNDLHICAYIHLGLSTKEIAALTFREIRSVESARNRLRKKLSIPIDTSLQSFLWEFAEKA